MISNLSNNISNIDSVEVQKIYALITNISLPNKLTYNKLARAKNKVLQKKMEKKRKLADKLSQTYLILALGLFLVLVFRIGVNNARQMGEGRLLGLLEAKCEYQDGTDQDTDHRDRKLRILHKRADIHFTG